MARTISKAFAVEFVVDVDEVELDEVVVELELVDVAEALVELVELLAELVLVELVELVEFVAVEVDEADEEDEDDDDEEDKKTDVEVLELETEVVLAVELDDEDDVVELPVCATESVNALPLWKWTYSSWSDRS